MIALLALLDGASLIGIGTIAAAGVSLLTWFVTKRGQGTDEGRGLIDDAIKLQQATHSAYEEALEEIELMRSEMQDVRDDIADLQAEMTHYRTVAREAREDYRTDHGRDPQWWRPFNPSPTDH